MAASKLASIAAMPVAAAATSTTNIVRVDAPSNRFNPFAQSPSPLSPTTNQSGFVPSNSDPKPEVEDSKRGFDAEALERAARTLRQINSYKYAKQDSYVDDEYLDDYSSLYSNL